MCKSARQEAPKNNAHLPQRLNSSDIHVWVSKTGATAVETNELRILPSSEISRARTIESKIQKCQFLQGRILLRRVLSLYMRRPAMEIRFRCNRNGKPTLIGRSQGIHFSVTHIDSLLLIAIRRGGLLGIDAEILRDHCDLGEIAAQFFSVRELDGLRSSPQKARFKLFYRFWTGKEAYIKAIGGRITNLGFKRIDLSDAINRSYLKTRQRFYVRWFTPIPGFIAAIACDSHPVNVRLFRWNDLQFKI